ncbi:hypothetical protein RJT34_20680 [Clitoria ternatea]|uniref:Uncharacterized protein n=1 Tax=Clitoria ternatea TaxID=43366 RepID=A0AAN9IT72_CLITE
MPLYSDFSSTTGYKDLMELNNVDKKKSKPNGKDENYTIKNDEDETLVMDCKLLTASATIALVIDDDEEFDGGWVIGE